MRGIATWLLVGAVAALGFAAAVDALLQDGESLPSAGREEAAPPAANDEQPAKELGRAAAALREAGVRGVLTYADEDCGLLAVTLPALGEHTAPGGRSCRFGRTIEGRVAFGPPAVARDGILRARCSEGTIELRLWTGRLYSRTPGCGIAWRGGGSPTFLRRGEVVKPAACPGDPPAALPFRCTRTLLAKADLERGLHPAGWDGFVFAVEEVLWLTDTRIAAIVRARSGGERAELLAVFEGRRLLAPPPAAYADLAELRPSPSGGFVAARILDPGGLAIVDRMGEFVRPAVRHGHAIAWSPDERWIAEATDEGVYVFRADERTPSVLVLPIMARDLVWR